MKSRRLSAIMFTDIVDYSRLMGRDESAAMTLLENKEEIISPIITLLSGVAFLVLITGIFTELYDFWYGVIGTIGVAIISASFKSLFGIQDTTQDIKDTMQDKD